MATEGCKDSRPIHRHVMLTPACIIHPSTIVLINHIYIDKPISYDRLYGAG